MTRVAVYTRLSSDPTGTQTATLRQQSACESFAAARDWTVTAVYEDVDISAYDARAIRPSYERLLQAIVDSELDGVLVWKLDRLMRRPSEFERMWTICERHRVFLASATEPIDTSNELGLAIVRVLVTFASLEAATLGLRIAAKNRERAFAGQPSSPTPAYGIARGWKRLVPREAALLREAAERVIEGESVNAIVRSWNDRGERAMKGGPWKPEVLRTMLQAPRLVGDRSYRGEVVAKGCFPAILDRVTWAQVQDSFGDRSMYARSRTPSARYRGIVVCGLCGTRCVVLNRWKRKQAAYCCAPPPTGCGRISVSAPDTDGYIDRQREQRAETLRVLHRDVSDVDAEHAHLEHAAAITALNREFYVAGSLGRREFNIRRQALDDALDRVVSTDPADLRRVIVLPTKTTGRFDPTRLRLEWRIDARVLLIDEISDMLRVHATTVRRWIKAGLLRSQQSDRMIYILPADLQAFIERGRIAPGDAPFKQSLALRPR